MRYIHTLEEKKFKEEKEKENELLRKFGVDEKIIQLLQKNARISIKDIASQVFLSSPAVTSRYFKYPESPILMMGLSQLGNRVHITYLL